MAETIAQHQQTAFSDPQNGQSPIDADQVRANDNSLRTKFNDHDADVGIHVQSSALGSRPAFGSAGRKWFSVDAGRLRVWYDNGSAWVEADYLSLTDGGTVAGAVTFSAAVAASAGITGNLTGNVTGNVTGNASTATALQTGRTIGLTGDVTATGVSFDGTGNITLTTVIAAGVIVNADINASAAIADTKLATISTAGKVSNSATTATSANTANAIVARDGTGAFSAQTITLAGNINLRGVTLVWPSANASGVLTNDGAGNLSWGAGGGGGGVSGSGTTNTIPRWTSSSALGNSIMAESSGTITVTGNLTVTGNVTLGDATSDTITPVGQYAGNIHFATDNAYDLGATGANRPRDLFLARNATIGGTLAVTGATTLNGNVTLGDATSDTVTITGRIGANIEAGSTHYLGTSAQPFGRLYLNSLSSGGVYVGGDKVVGARDTGWGLTVTGLSVGRTNNISQTQLLNAPSALDDAATQGNLIAVAEVVYALYVAAQAHGLVN